MWQEGLEVDKIRRRERRLVYTEKGAIEMHGGVDFTVKMLENCAIMRREIRVTGSFGNFRYKTDSSIIFGIKNSEIQ